MGRLVGLDLTTANEPVKAPTETTKEVKTAASTKRGGRKPSQK